ncbi:hypothetical protein [Aureliella helgolandensis]|uniref:Secreted protein n=1 Tax=Aureliella helgolandensis TaxID=2527968 RepID=A0A518GFC9_9BACT|nr:hypothetical protein [Aureliella helgolandensis]QDV27305.1 hypothetical protein Q31a_56930 [Aureliella helgolandensis]
MKKVLFSVLALAACCIAAPAQAGFVTAYSSQSLNDGTFDFTLGTAVYKGTAGDDMGIGLADGDYAYLYQVTQQSNTLSGIDSLTVSTASLAAASGSIGSAANAALSGSGFTAGGVSLDTFTAGTPTSLFDLVSSLTSRGAHSKVLYLVSSRRPADIDGPAFVGLGGSPSGSVSAPGPAAVPLPPALALALVGVPFVRMLKKRNA